MKKGYRLLQNQKGQGVTEYALGVLLMVLVISAVFGTNNPLADTISGTFDRAGQIIDDFMNGGDDPGEDSPGSGDRGGGGDSGEDGP